MKYLSFSVLVVVLLSTSLLIQVAVGTAAEGNLDQHLPGWEMARFLPLQGRMVLEHDGEMLVVRSGEEIPGLPGARLRTIGSGGALIEIEELEKASGTAEEQSKYWLLIRSAQGGTIEVIVIHSLPEEPFLPELPVEAEEVPVFKAAPGSVLKHLPENREGEER